MTVDKNRNRPTAKKQPYVRAALRTILTAVKPVRRDFPFTGDRAALLEATRADAQKQADRENLPQAIFQTPDGFFMVRRATWVEPCIVVIETIAPRPPKTVKTKKPCAR